MQAHLAWVLLTAAVSTADPPPQAGDAPQDAPADAESGAAPQAPTEPPTATTASPEVSLDITGNVVMPDEVYQVLVARWLRQGLVPPEADAVAEALRRFLNDAGYRLARVTAVASDSSTIRVRINEGRVARVLFRGPSTVDILQMKVQVSIPYDVYNARSLERQLDALEDFGLVGARAELVPLRGFHHEGLQLENITAVEGPASVAPPLPYELHIIMADQEWDQGLEAHIDYDSSAGTVGGGSYAGESLLLSEDRWRIGLDIGATYFDGLEGRERQLQLSKASLEAIWYAPPLVRGFELRPALRPFVDLEVRQRRDLVIQTYDLLRTGIVGSLDYRILAGLSASAIAGVEYRQMFDVDQLLVDPPVPPVRGFSQGRAFAGLEVDLVFDPDEPRLDRRHQLRVQGRRYLTEDLYAVDGAYQHIFEWGWHDLWLRLGGAGLFGDLVLVDELPIDVYLRGMFNHRFWVQWVAASSFEFRYSITSDVLKASVFADLALFEDPGRGRRNRGLKLANGSGVGMHALVGDLIQVDFYVAVGFASDGTFDAGVLGQMTKAF